MPLIFKSWYNLARRVIVDLDMYIHIPLRVPAFIWVDFFYTILYILVKSKEITFDRKYGGNDYENC